MAESGDTSSLMMDSPFDPEGTQIYYPCEEKYNTGIWPEVTSVVWNDRLNQEAFNRFFQGKRFPSLTALWIENQGISDLSVISEYDQLTALNCSGNYLFMLPEIRGLRYLVCRANQLGTLPSMPLLEHLDCSYNRIERTDQHPFGSSRLNYLSISENRLCGRISMNCPDLVYLDVSKNKIDQLVLDCPRLKDLYCYQNNITTTQGFSRCPSLRNLTCNQNPLGDLNGLENCSSLHIVYACNGLVPSAAGGYLLVN